MARFRINGKVVRYHWQQGKKLALVVVKDADNQRHIPLWTPIFDDMISLTSFIEALDQKILIQVEGWINLQQDGKFILRADRITLQENPFPFIP